MINNPTPADISVILPVYNGERYIRETIDSILSQTFRNFELIIINDASTDATGAIIREYADSRIQIHCNETNRGLIYTLNRGLTLCTGKYIARIDADDIALPRRLQTQFDFMEANPEIGVCGCSIEIFNDKNTRRQRVDFAGSDLDIRAFTFFQSPFNHPSSFIRKSVFDRHHLQYPEQYLHAEDYGLWIEVLKYTKGANIPEVLTRYRKHEMSITAVDEKTNNKRIEVLMQLHTLYLNQNGIVLSPEQMKIYTPFTDRSFTYVINAQNRQAIEQVLKDFLTQLSKKQAALYPGVLNFLSINTFYKFFINRQIPRSAFLLKLYGRGAIHYLKRFF